MADVRVNRNFVQQIDILLCCQDKKVGENKGVTQNVQQPNPLRNSFARVFHSPSVLCLSKLEINFSALPDFLFRGKFMWLLCAGFLHIGGICNIICEAIHFSRLCHPMYVYSKKLTVQTHHGEDIIFGARANSTNILDKGRSNKYFRQG